MPVYGATRPMQGHARSCMHMNIPPNLTHRRPRPRRYVMMSKRWTCVRRDPKALLTQQLLPLGLVRAFTYFAPHPRLHIFRPASAPSPSVPHPRLHLPSCIRAFTLRPACDRPHSASHTARLTTARLTHRSPFSQVALVLLILTVEDPRVGPPLRMHAAVFQRKQWNAATRDPPTQFVANGPPSAELFRQMDQEVLTTRHRTRSLEGFHPPSATRCNSVHPPSSPVRVSFGPPSSLLLVPF